MTSLPEPFRVVQPPGGPRALPEGITEWDLRSPRYRRLFSGVYVSARATITPRLLAMAALLLASSGSVASHHTAARIWGGIVPDDGHVHLTCRGHRVQVRGIRAHRTRLGQDVTTFRGTPVTVPSQTFLDLSDELGLVDLVVLGDSLVKAGRVTPQVLIAAAADYRGRSRRVARRAASLVRRDVDSPMESRLRMLIVLAGLPEPKVNYRILGANGVVIWRFDLSYPKVRLIIEYDGRQHAESEQQWGWDLGRREWIDDNDWRLLVVVARDIYNQPARTLQRITTVMRERGLDVPTLSEEWRLHFTSLPDDIAAPS